MPKTLSKQFANFLHQATIYHQAGNFTEAETLYKRVLASYPKQYDALHWLGVIQVQKGNIAEGALLIKKSLHSDNVTAFGYYNYALAMQNLTKYDESLEYYNKTIDHDSTFFLAHNNKGNILRTLKRFKESIQSYEAALTANPKFPEGYNNLGAVYLDLKKPDAAKSLFLKAIEIKQDYYEAHYNLGNTLRDLGLYDDALNAYDTAIKINPNYAEAHFNRGGLFELIAQSNWSIGSKPRQNIYENASVNQDRSLCTDYINQASRSYEAAVDINPDYDYWLGALLHTKCKINEWKKFDIFLNEIAIRALNKKRVINPFPALSLFDNEGLHQIVAQTYGQHKFNKISKSVNFRTNKNKSKPVRIGYYSADFHNHATAHLISELLESHDSNQFELFGFSFGPNKIDPSRQRIENSFHEFYDVTNMSDQAVAELSRELGIDIAVDLKGYTKDSRTGIFAEGCAPIQVNFLGYPGTMGVDYIDYIIADKTVIPEESQQYYTEKVVYLPHSYQVNDSTRKISDRVFTKDEVGLPEQGFVFCCFNNNYKILPPTFDGWMRILRAVPNSVLWLFEDNPTAAQNLRKEAIARDIDPTRLVFAKRLPLDEHLARHRLADLFIDTLPCNAHTTASDALWTGLPVLTCMGQSFAARVACSLLNALDLPELITNTQEAYEAKAVELALNPNKLAAIKKKLECNRLTSPLFNGRLFAKHLEAAYTEMYDRYRAGLKTDHIYVQAEKIEPTRLNLGCGFDKRDGWVNADNFPECAPDLLFNIESTPWPIQDGEYEYVLMKHVLEHVGGTFDGFTAIMRELYRVITPGGTIEIHVPHYRHDTWWSDPTHVRAFTPLTFQMMSKRQNDEWIANKANYTMLAYLMKVDFEVTEAVQVYDPRWWQQVEAGQITKEQIRSLADTQWGVVKELQVKLKAIK